MSSLSFMELWIRLEIVPGSGSNQATPSATMAAPQLSLGTSQTVLQVPSGIGEGAPEAPLGPPDAVPQLMGITDAARYLGLSRSALYAALASGRIALAPIKVGRAMKLSRAQLDRWLAAPERHTAAATPHEPPRRRQRRARQPTASSPEEAVLRRLRAPRPPSGGAG